MRRIWILILFLAISCQLSVVSGQQTSCMEDTIAQLSKSQYAKDLYMQAQNSLNSGHIVDACENCFKVIEFIERDVKKRELDKSFYEPLAHAHYCLGKIFVSENYVSLSLIHCKESLHYFEKFESDSILAHINKFVGLIFTETNIDSAKYYLNRCIELDPTNRFHKYDVDKAIAGMLYYDEGYKDSAVAILRNNLDKVEHDNVREAYHGFLGNIFINEKEYDSALYHYKKCTESSEFFIRLGAIKALTILYDSIGDLEKKAYYESILSKLAVERVDGEIERANIMSLYNDHLNRMHEIRNMKITKMILLIAIPIVVIVMFFVIYLIHRNKKRIKAKDDVIIDVKFRNSIIEGKIKKKNEELAKRDKHIKELESELAKIESKLTEDNVVCDFQLYLQSDISSKILEIAKENQSKSFDENETRSLTHAELALLSQSANIYLNNVINRISVEFPKLKKDDLYYLCLIILDLNDRQISSLLGVSYDAVWVRKKKICSIFDINNNEIKYFLSTKFQ